jgi:hypothetical protein
VAGDTGPISHTALRPRTTSKAVEGSQPRHKYTIRRSAGGAEPWQLFDLQRDPVELWNLVADPAHAATAAELPFAALGRHPGLILTDWFLPSIALQ